MALRILDSSPPESGYDRYPGINALLYEIPLETATGFLIAAESNLR